MEFFSEINKRAYPFIRHIRVTHISVLISFYYWDKEYQVYNNFVYQKIIRQIAEGKQEWKQIVYHKFQESHVR